MMISVFGCFFINLRLAIPMKESKDMYSIYTLVTFLLFWMFYTLCNVFWFCLGILDLRHHAKPWDKGGLCEQLIPFLFLLAACLQMCLFKPCQIDKIWCVVLGHKLSCIFVVFLFLFLFSAGVQWCRFIPCWDYCKNCGKIWCVILGHVILHVFDALTRFRNFHMFSLKTYINNINC